MRIAVDARELAGQRTGVGRFLAEIVSEWARLPEIRDHQMIFCAPAPLSDEFAATLAAVGGRTEVEPGGGTMWEQVVLPRLAARVQADVLFCPGYSGPILGATALVVAIHDVSFAAHPEWFGWKEGFRRRLVTRSSARRAARIITISEFSRREIVEHLGVPVSKIQVVYPGVTALPGAERSTETDAARREPLVLYVGSIFNRRHVPELIRGFSRVAREHRTARLTIVGDNRSFPYLDLAAHLADTPHARNVRITSYVADEELGDLYRQAGAFAFLSEYEGFGLTPLEALAAGIPIVVLDTEVAREVYGDAAIYVANPDPPLIAKALERALFDRDARSRVLAAAPAVLSRYSWRQCASRVLELLLEAAAPPRGRAAAG